MGSGMMSLYKTHRQHRSMEIITRISLMTLGFGGLAVFLSAQSAFATFHGKWLMASDQTVSMLLELTEKAGSAVVTGSYKRADGKTGTLESTPFPAGIIDTDRFPAGIEFTYTENGGGDKGTCLMVLRHSHGVQKRFADGMKGVCKSAVSGNMTFWSGVRIPDKVDPAGIGTLSSPRLEDGEDEATKQAPGAGDRDGFLPEEAPN